MLNYTLGIGANVKEAHLRVVIASDGKNSTFTAWLHCDAQSPFSTLVPAKPNIMSPENIQRYK